MWSANPYAISAPNRNVSADAKFHMSAEPSLPAAVHEYTEVAEFLWDLMGRCHQPGHHTDADVDHERPANGQTTDQVVQAVCQQDQISEWAALEMLVVFGAVTVVPVQKLLEHEEHQESSHECEVDPELVADARRPTRAACGRRLHPAAIRPQDRPSARAGGSASEPTGTP